MYMCVCKKSNCFCAVEIRSRFYSTRDGGWKGGVISSQTSIKFKMKEVKLGITFEVINSRLHGLRLEYMYSNLEILYEYN